MQKFQSLNNVINSNICVEDQWQSFKNSLNFGIEKYIPTSEHTFNNIINGVHHCHHVNVIWLKRNIDYGQGITE